MKSDDFRVAIDIGTTKICTMVGRIKDQNTYEVINITTIDNNGMNRGLVVDEQLVSECITKSIESISKDVGINIDKAFFGVSGAHLESKNHWTNISRPSGMTSITQNDIDEALKIASKIDLNNDRKLLHAIPRSYTLDGLHGIVNPLGMHTAELHVETHIITGSLGSINNIQNCLSKSKIKVAGIVAEPLASAEAVLSPTEKEEGCVVVDIGGGTTDIAVFDNGNIVHSKVLPIGGNLFTSDISIALDLELNASENLKINYGNIGPDQKNATDEITIKPIKMDEEIQITRRELGQILKERAAELIRMISLSLDEPHLVDTDISKFVFTGGGSKLNGFMNVAKYILQANVRLAEPRGLYGIPNTQNDPSISTVVGIMLWGIENKEDSSHAFMINDNKDNNEADENSSTFSKFIKKIKL
ncbi:MAG: cell division protein FtsA [Chloroflexi bacterium]|nr:cell division protein FtsA [Chloroflexota bacterium]